MSNYWMNIILIDELVEKIADAYKKYLGKQWSTQSALLDKLNDVQDDFYHKNPKYVKVQGYVKLEFMITYDFVLQKVQIVRYD